MFQTMSSLRAFATLVPVNREAALFAAGLMIALSLGGILAEAALHGAATPPIR